MFIDSEVTVVCSWPLMPAIPMWAFVDYMLHVMVETGSVKANTRHGLREQGNALFQGQTHNLVVYAARVTVYDWLHSILIEAARR